MKPQVIFETMMRANGYSEQDLKKSKERYVSNGVQTRWKYFLMGWEMRGLV